MELSEFKRLLRQAHKRERNLGLLFFVLGGFISVMLIVKFEGLHWDDSIGAKIGTVIGFIAGFGVGGFGLFWLCKALLADLRIVSGKHLILKAIEDAQQPQVAWIFDTTFEHYRNAIRYAEIHFTIYLDDGTRFVLGFDESKRVSMQKMQQFLVAKFSDVEVGYDKKTRAIMSKRFGKKV